MATNGDHDCQREHSSNTSEIYRICFGSLVNSEQNSPENQTPDRQRLDQPGDAYGFPQISVNQGGIQQLTQLHPGQRSGQPDANNSIDQGREQPQALMQQQPDTSSRKRQRQQSIPDSYSPVIRQTIPEDKRVRKRAADKRYRDRIRDERRDLKSEVEKLKAENGQLKDENGDLKSEEEKLKAENGQLKDENGDLKSEVEKLKAENGQLKNECQRMKSYGVEPGAENRYFSRKDSDTFRSFTQGSDPSQVSGFQDVDSIVQPSNINSFDDLFDEYFPIRSHEMPENEDIQLIRSHEMPDNGDMQLIDWPFSMGGHASINMLEDCYTSPLYTPSPTPNFDEDFSHPGKIIIGWLKIKAAMRWGFFIRKKAAERRAQIVELEEEEWLCAFL